jgi:hypothetical protein
MKNKIKIFFAVLITGIVLFGGWWIWDNHKPKKLNLEVSSSYQPYKPYIYFDQKIFTTGFLKLPEEQRWGLPIPKIEGEPIYDSFIDSEIYPSWAKLVSGSNLKISDFSGKFCLFIGHRKAYLTNALIKENPNVEWLRNISLMHFGVFEIEQVIPVKDDSSLLSLDTPERLSEEFEITTTVKNSLPIELTDAVLKIKLYPAGSYMIVGGESYYDKTIQSKYNGREEKTFNFKIKSRFKENITHPIKISVYFSGYGIENGVIKPVYSSTTQSY